MHDRVSHVEKKSDPGDTRPNLLEHLKLLVLYLGGERAEAGDVSAGARQRCHYARTNRITTGRHHNRSRRGLLFGCRYCWRSTRHDDVNVKAQQLRHEAGEPFSLTIGGAVFDHEVLAFDVPEFS